MNTSWNPSEEELDAVGYPFPSEDIEDERYRLECELDQLTLEVVPKDHYAVIWYSSTDMPRQESFPTFAAACEFDERLSDCGVITSGVMGGMD